MRGAFIVGISTEDVVEGYGSLDAGSGDGIEAAPLNMQARPP